MSFDYPDIGEAVAIHDALIEEFGGQLQWSVNCRLRMVLPGPADV